MPQAARIFVSHAHEDSQWCRNFVAALRKAGADVWYDEHDMGYGGLYREINKQLLARPIFIVILSPRSVASTWVEREINAAISLQDQSEESERILLPVVAEKCVIPPLLLGERRISGSGDTGIVAVEAASRVIHALGLTPADAPPATPPPAPAETAEQAYERGSGLYAQNRYEEALAAYEQAIGLDQKYKTAWNGRGNVLRDLKRPAEALAAYKQALVLDPKYKYAWYGKAYALRDLLEYEQALVAFEEALALHPSYANLWNGKGNTLVDLKRPDEALASYEQALKLNPRYAFAMLGKGNALRALKRNDEALAAYEQALTIDSKFKYAWNNKVNLLDQLGRKAEADEARRQRDAALKGS